MRALVFFLTGFLGLLWLLDVPPPVNPACIVNVPFHCDPPPQR